MTQYSEQFKLAVVQKYMSGEAGYKAIAREYNLDFAMVRRWVKWFQSHGTDGLKKKSARYTAAVKLAVLQAIRNNELSHLQAYTQFNIRSPGIIGAWEPYERGGIDGLQPRPRGRPKAMTTPKSKPAPAAEEDKRTREELMVGLNDLRMENAYLKKLRALIQAQRNSASRKKRK